jgi:3-oxoacyl-[acyl-carrier protein] reductase
MAFSLNGHVAIVTGSSTGLGKAIALALGKAGAKVAVNYLHNRERAQRTFAEFQNAGVGSILVQSDVTSEAGVEQLFRATEAALGQPDILVPNATCDQPLKRLEEYDWAFHQAMLDFFVRSPYLLARRGLAAMKAKKWGRIINITSDVFYRSMAPFSAYVAAKGGQIGWSRSMSRELAPFGITVNMVAPGWIPVERHAKDPQAAKDAYLAEIPLGRWGMPQDVGNAVLFFASEESSFLTGQTLYVDGGLSLP